MCVYVCARARPPSHSLAVSTETHLLTAAHLIPLLSTGKRVFSLSLSLFLFFFYPLSESSRSLW